MISELNGHEQRFYRILLVIIGTILFATAVSAVPSKASEPRRAPGFLHSGMLASPESAKATTNASVQSLCNGTFSDGSSINVSSPAYLQDVPGQQVFCDFHTFAWNQFIYLTQMQADPNNSGAVTPLFLHLAPWYNLLKPNGSPAPAAYPGGSTALEASNLDQNQAGDDDILLDVNSAMVRYDIRFNSAMYSGIADTGTNTQTGFNNACKPGSNGTCTNNLFLPPTASGQSGSMEVKSAWRDFGTEANCPQSQYYCNGRFGLVGLHIVQKTPTHGEWVWMSFEHVANDPDCYPDGDSPIAENSPLGTPWSFFNTTTVETSVMSSKMCEVTGTTPQCNANPKVYGKSKYIYTYKSVNVCRTNYLPPGGASTANCTVVPDGPPQQSSNSPGNVACLNATFMPQMSGVWKNYKMIGSLWLRGTTAGNVNFRVQIFQQPVSGMPYEQPVGFPNLANTMMETWMQSGSTGYDPAGTNATQAGCFLCHNLPSNAGQFAADDLSHFPGKLPQSLLQQTVKDLLPANSTRKVQTIQRTISGR